MSCHLTHFCVSVYLVVNELSEYLWKLSEVDVDQLCLEIETEQRKEVPLFNQNQLIVSLKGGL